MQFIDKPYGRYRIYAGSLADPAGKSGFIATLVIKVSSADGVSEREVFRDLLPVDGLVWRDERDALFYAVRRAEYIIDARPALLADVAGRRRAPWSPAEVRSRRGSGPTAVGTWGIESVTGEQTEEGNRGWRS